MHFLIRSNWSNWSHVEPIELKSCWTTNQLEPKNGQLMVIHDCYQIMIEFTLSDHNQITNYDHISTKYFPYELESMIIHPTIRLIKSQSSIRLSNLRSNKVIIVESMRHSMLSTWSSSTELFNRAQWSFHIFLSIRSKFHHIFFSPCWCWTVLSVHVCFFLCLSHFNGIF